MSSPYDRIAWLYDLVMDGHYDHYARCARIVLDLLGPVTGAVVLDIGGGTGGVAARLAGHGARALVLDRSHGLARRAGRRSLAATTADATRLPYRDAIADAVLFCEALHHLGADGAALAALAEAWRVLRESGMLLIFDIEPPATVGERIHLGLERLLFGPIRCWPREALLQAVASQGFATSAPLHPEVTHGYVVLGVKQC